MINLKLNPQKIELKNKNIGYFKVKMHIQPMLEVPLIPINISQN
jgi:hypothetical protein